MGGRIPEVLLAVASLQAGKGGISRVARLMAQAPPSLGPMELITEGLAPTAAEIFEGRSLDYLLRRRAAIDAEPALHERELRKFSLMSEALEQGFRDRGVDDLTAQLAAEIAVTTFQIAVTRCHNQHGDPDLRPPWPKP